MKVFTATTPDSSSSVASFWAPAALINSHGTRTAERRTLRRGCARMGSLSAEGRSASIRGLCAPTISIRARFPCLLQPRRHVLVLARERHARHEPHGLHQGGEILLQMLVRVGFERGGAEVR